MFIPKTVVWNFTLSVWNEWSQNQISEKDATTKYVYNNNNYNNIDTRRPKDKAPPTSPNNIVLHDMVYVKELLKFDYLKHSSMWSNRHKKNKYFD